MNDACECFGTLVCFHEFVVNVRWLRRFFGRGDVGGVTVADVFVLLDAEGVTSITFLILVQVTELDTQRRTPIYFRRCPSVCADTRPKSGHQSRWAREARHPALNPCAVAQLSSPRKAFHSRADNHSLRTHFHGGGARCVWELLRLH